MGRFIFGIICFSLVVTCSEKSIQNPEVPEEPQVKIVSPEDNSILTDSATIVVEATDDKGVVKVEIYINNQTGYDRTFYVEPYRYIWRTPQYQDTNRFRIYAKAYDGDDNVSSSNVITVTVYKFQPPSNLKIFSTGSLPLYLSWHDNTVGESEFYIERSRNYGNFVPIGTVPENDTIYSDSLVDTTNIYSYRVKAKRENRETPFSETVNAKYTPNMSTIRSKNASYSPIPNEPVPFQVIENSIVYCLNMSFIAWDFVNNSELFNWVLYGNRKYASLEYDTIGDVVATGTTTGDVLLYFFNHGSLDYKFKLKADSTEINDLAFSPDHLLLYTLNSAGTVKVWSVEDGTFTRSYHVTHGVTNSLALSPDNTRFATAGNDSTIKIWDLNSGTLLLTIPDPEGAVRKAVYTADGNSIISISRDESLIKKWDSMNGTLLNTLFGHTAEVTSIARESTGAYLLSGDRYGRVVLWSLSTNSILYANNNIHHNTIIGLDFYNVPDSDIIYVGSMSHSGKIQAWKLRKEWIRIP